MFGSISLHVIAVASLTVIVKGVASGVTFALPINVTLPVFNVNWFPVTTALAAAVITTLPADKVSPLPVTVTLAEALITTFPVSAVKGLPYTLTRAPASVDAAPIDSVKGLPVTLTVTLGSNTVLDIGRADMALKPSIYYAPLGYLVFTACLSS